MCSREIEGGNMKNKILGKVNSTTNKTFKYMEKEAPRQMFFYQGCVCLDSKYGYFHTSLVKTMEYNSPMLKCKTMNSVYEFEVLTDPEDFNIQEFSKGEFT